MFRRKSKRLKRPWMRLVSLGLNVFSISCPIQNKSVSSSFVSRETLASYTSCSERCPAGSGITLISGRRHRSHHDSHPLGQDWLLWDSCLLGRGYDRHQYHQQPLQVLLS